MAKYLIVKRLIVNLRGNKFISTTKFGRVFNMDKDAWKSLPPKDLLRQLSPNLWNPAKDKLAIVEDHIKFINDGSDEARKKLRHRLDIPYGEKDAKFDIYGTNLPANAPVFFWVHGGGWQMNSKESSSFFAESIVNSGVTCIVVGYNLAPEVKLEVMRSDIRAALKKAMKMFPQSRFIICGHSAGAHLTANLLHTNKEEFPKELCDRISGFFLISGVYDMRVFIPTFININLQMTPEESEDLSPLLKWAINPNFVRDDLQVILAVGKYESPLFKFQTEAYAQHLKNFKLKPTFCLSQDDDHFSIVEQLKNSSSYMYSFLQSLLVNNTTKSAVKMTSKF